MFTVESHDFKVYHNLTYLLKSVLEDYMILAACSCYSVFGGTREENPGFPFRAKGTPNIEGGRGRRKTYIFTNFQKLYEIKDNLVRLRVHKKSVRHWRQPIQ